MPFHSWQDWLESNDRDLVWGAPFFSKTGIEPYVRPGGARVPSLRRVAEKYPYFTNGSAATLRDVLTSFRYRGVQAWHAHDPARHDSAADSLPRADIESVDGRQAGRLGFVGVDPVARCGETGARHRRVAIARTHQVGGTGQTPRVLLAGSREQAAGSTRSHQSADPDTE